MEEVYKVIDDYERYSVSNLGNVINNVSKKQLKTRCSYGYCRVTLYDENHQRKDFMVHRLVAMMFVANPENLPCVNHKDECRSNNIYTNLEWCTYEYNNNYGNHNSKIAESMSGDRNHSFGKTAGNAYRAAPIRCIETGEIYQCQVDAANAVGVCKSAINNVLTGLRKTAGGYHFERI